MNLIRDDANPALWVNDQWEQGSPGTFAVVIGVSRYRHLDFSARSFGLGSLYCSALTAHYVFQWLREQYRGPDLAPDQPRPLAKVGYLVAPTQAEIDIEPALGDAPVEPTRQACEEAIAWWDEALRSLSAENARRSSSVFFFSGHGIEVHPREQILLPSDYLAPPARNVNKGISTVHLHDGLGDLKLNEQLFFIDACRNDVDALRALNPRGETILNQPNADRTNYARIAALFHATASGQQAFQPTDPGEGPSLFGKALLEGLRGRPNIRLVGDGDRCTVNLLALNQFLKNRVAELLAERSATVLQPVTCRMDNVDDFPISVVSRERATAVTRGDGVVGGLAAAGVRSMGEITEGLLTLPVAADAAEYNVAETIWSGAEIYNFKDRTWRAATEAAELGAVTRDQRGRVMRLDFWTREKARQWLRIRSGTGSFAFVLPGDRRATPVYRLEMILARTGRGRDRGFGIDQATLDLAPTGEDGLGYAAELWQIYSDHDLGTAAEALDMNMLEELLHDKFLSPLGASVAGTVLLGTGSLWRMHTWARNLARFFPEWPEGPVLWAHQLIRQEGEVRRYRGRRGDFAVEEHEDPLPWLFEIERRGLPGLSDLMGIAIEVAEIQRRQLDDLPPDTRERLASVQQWLGEALRHFRPGGLFAGFHARNPDQLVPRLVQPR